MATLTIRNLDEQLKGSLRVRAAPRGRSMEEEARQILRTAPNPAVVAWVIAQPAARSRSSTRRSLRSRFVTATHWPLAIGVISRVVASRWSIRGSWAECRLPDSFRRFRRNRTFDPPQAMKPRSVRLPKFPRFGNTVLRSAVLAPSHFDRVAAY